MQFETEERTFLFTDIEGSTQLWNRYPAAMRTALARHDAILRTAVQEQGGHIFKTIGDAFCVAFAEPEKGLLSAVTIQKILATENWGEVGAIRVRMALHCGPAEARDGDYFGLPLNRVARLRDAAHGGQIIASRALRDCIGDPPQGITLESCGEPRLKGLEEFTEPVFQVTMEGLEADFPPLGVDENQYRHNLPADTTTFVGREAESRAVRDLLKRPSARLVTLSGMGGTGKTRLALHVAEQMLWRYPEGIWYVDLAVLSSAADLLPSLARACGLKEDPSQTPAEQLAAHFRNARALLVLDNFERYEDAADDVADLLKATENLQTMVTSRVLLEMNMEHEYPVPPLGGRECISLFAARAAQAQSDFVLNPENRADIEAICARLEGMPLAVELAAAQIRRLRPAEIREALDQRLQVLSTRMRDLHPRHRSLRSTIDWSYEMLTETEQGLFRSLSCFVGGFTADATRHVCGEPCGIVAGAVTEFLDSLRQKSLLRQDQVNAEVSGEAPADGARFSLLESLREYGQEILDRDDIALRDTLRQRHTDYFLQLVEQQEPLLGGAGQLAATVLLDREAANIRAARDRALASGTPNAAARFGVALRRFWGMRGWMREGQEFLDRVLAREDRIDDPELRASLLLAAGLLNWSGPRAPRAMALLERCVSLCRERGFSMAASIEARALTGLGMAAYGRGELSTADHYYEEALVLRRTLKDIPGEAGLLTNLGIQALERADYARAATLFRQALPLREQQGDAAMIANLWNCIGAAAEGEGDLKEARNAFTISQSLFDQLGASVMAAFARLNLGSVAIGEERWEEARHRFEEALEVLRPEQDFLGVPDCLLGLGRVALATGDRTTARRLCGEGLAAYRQAGDRKGIPVALESLAEIAAADGDGPAALRYLAAAERLRADVGGGRRWQQEQLVTRLIARLGTPTTATAAAAEAALAEAERFTGVTMATTAA